MKQYMKKIIIYFMMVAYLFMLCPSYVYASDHGGGGGTNHNSDFITDSGTINVNDDGVVMYYIEYILANIGAIIRDHDLTKAMANDQTMKEYISKGKFDANEKTVTFPKETVIYVKQCFDEYAKIEQAKEENGGFYLIPTVYYDDVPASYFSNSSQYKTFRNIVMEKGLLGVRTNYRGGMYFEDPFSNPDHHIALIGTESYLDNYKNDPEQRVHCTFFCLDCWQIHGYPGMAFPNQGEIYTSCSEAVKETGTMAYLTGLGVNSMEAYNFSLYSTTGERVRVFISQDAAKEYSLNKRKVYFTKEYYNYVPDDLTVAVDDLQKSVDDLQAVIDKLLEQISKDTSENDIEDLLKQILDEIRKNPGGGGGGSGGGDVTVSVDLKETNNWLSKIYAKLSEIDEKMSSFVGSMGQAAMDKIQASLDEISETLKKIRNWAAVDTVIDGVDAVADWLDLIYSVLKDGTGSAVSAVSTLAEDATDLMSQKFPFSIPWDILFFVSVLSAEPETPHFEIPFNFEYPALDLAVDYTMELDFTPLQWLSDLSRLILSMTYAAGLMKKTAEIVLTSKE